MTTHTTIRMAITTTTKLTLLLHLSDPTLPIGGYAHSYGMESYVQRGDLSSVESAAEYITNSLHHNAKYNDAIYVRLAWETTIGGDCEMLTTYDEECSATKSPMEIRQASLKLGVRLLKIFNRRISGEAISRLEGLASAGGCHYPIAYGVVAAELGLDLRETLLSFYYNSLVAMVTNAVKLIPLGQLSGQDMLFELEEGLPELVEETITLDPSMRGVSAVGFDIGAMQHERLYSRLYMS